MPCQFSPFQCETFRKNPLGKAMQFLPQRRTSFLDDQRRCSDGSSSDHLAIRAEQCRFLCKICRISAEFLQKLVAPASSSWAAAAMQKRLVSSSQRIIAQPLHFSSQHSALGRVRRKVDGLCRLCRLCRRTAHLSSPAAVRPDRRELIAW